MEDRSVIRERGAATRPRRRLKPEVAARFAREGGVGIGDLYAKPVERLTPSELGRMKEAFLRDE